MVRDRRAITDGAPLSARSIGTVICCSTSSAARPGYSVITTACVSEISGYASTFNSWNDHTPSTTSPSAATIVTNRLRTANRSNLAIMLLRLQQHRPVHHGAVPRMQPRKDRHLVADPPARLHFDGLESPRRSLHPHHRPAALLHHRARRQH